MSKVQQKDINKAAWDACDKFRGVLDPAQYKDYILVMLFVETNKMVSLGSGARRNVKDCHLFRCACYLIVQNGDPSKPVIVSGQTYFAVIMIYRVESNVQKMHVANTQQ